MADTNGVISLKHIVKRALRKANEDKSKYRIFFQYAIDGYRDLNLYTSPESFKQVKLTVDPSLFTVDFPSDLVEFVYISVNINGQVWTLTRENQMIKTTTESGGGETLTEADGEGVDILKNASYSYQSDLINTQGYYDIDYIKRRLFIRNIPVSNVIMGYISSGTSVTETTYVPIKMYPAIEAYIMCEYSKYRDDKPGNAKIYYKELFDQERNKLQYTYLPSLDEFRDMIVRSHSQLPRR